MWRISARNVNPPGALTEKNAADLFGERSFMFGYKSDNPRLKPSGQVTAGLYDNGVVLQVPVSYSKTGPYAMCNIDYKLGNSTYSCHDNHSPYVGATFSGWYSFPQKGENVYWHQGDCPDEMVTLPVKVVVDWLAAANHCDCPKSGSVKGDPWDFCAGCILNMTDEKYVDVWTHIFSKGASTTDVKTQGTGIIV